MSKQVKNVVRNEKLLNLRMLSPIRVACKVKDLQHHINAYALHRSIDDRS